MTHLYRNLGHLMCAGFTLLLIHAMVMGHSGGWQIFLFGMIALSVLTQIMVTLELILKRLELNVKERS